MHDALHLGRRQRLRIARPQEMLTQLGAAEHADGATSLAFDKPAGQRQHRRDILRSSDRPCFSSIAAVAATKNPCSSGDGMRAVKSATADRIANIAPGRTIMLAPSTQDALPLGFGRKLSDKGPFVQQLSDKLPGRC
jgi:hypothetical protein